MRRSGNVCDTLVFLLVAVLLPAWLLGHLFLTFFPTSGSGTASQLGATDRSTSVAALADGSGSSSKDSSDDGAIALLTDEPDSDASSAADVGQKEAQWKQELAGFKTKISGLSSENQNLAMQAKELESVKSKQQEEIAELKGRLQQMSNESDRAENSAMSTDLRNAQNDFARLENEFKTIQLEKSQLVSRITELESKNQKLAMSSGSSNSNNDLQQELETQVQNLKDQLQESENKLAEQRRLADKMQSRTSDDSNNAEAVMAANKKMLGEANAEKSRLQGRVNELITALESAKSDLAGQKKELADSNSQLQQLNAKYALTLKRLAGGKAANPGQSGSASTNRQSVPIEPSQLLTTNPPATEQYREFVSSRGNRSRLAFIQWSGDDQVVVRSFANKQLYQVPIERFSLPDQKYLKELKQTNGR